MEECTWEHPLGVRKAGGGGAEREMGLQWIAAESSANATYTLKVG